MKKERNKIPNDRSRETTFHMREIGKKESEKKREKKKENFL